MKMAEHAKHTLTSKNVEMFMNWSPKDLHTVKNCVEFGSSLLYVFLTHHHVLPYLFFLNLEMLVMITFNQ